MSTMNQAQIKKTRNLITLVSIVIPVAVAILFKVQIPGVDLHFLPPFYTTINGITAVTLIAALIMIKKKNMDMHRKLIRFSLLLSLIFLVCYVAYHMTSEPTTYGGNLKGLYYFILISHIGLSLAVVPLVLFTYLFAWQGNYEKHKKWTKIAWPIWFYVAVTGVIVYLMISPFYTH
jgi:putative membrane protein